MVDMYNVYFYFLLKRCFIAHILGKLHFEKLARDASARKCIQRDDIIYEHNGLGEKQTNLKHGAFFFPPAAQKQQET